MNKTMKLGMVGLVASSLVLAVGCSGGAESDKTEIEFFSQKVEMKGTLDEIIADFEKENPDIDVKLTSVSNAGTVLKTRVAGGDIPDIVHTYPQNPDFKGWAADGKFLDLSDEDFLSNLKQGAAESYAVDGGIYSLPLNSNAWGFFYNKTKFEELGLEAPKTWSEFEDVVKEIKAAGETPFAAALTTDDSWTMNGYHQLAWATTTGGFDQTQDALKNSPKDGIKVGNEDFETVADKLSLVSGNTQKNANGASYSDAVALFAREEALIFPNGIWALPVIRDQQPDFEVSMFAFPGQEAGQEMTVGAADLALSVSSAGSEAEQEASKKLLAYMTEGEVMQKYYDKDGSPTSVEAVDTDGAFEETKAVSDLVFTDKQIIWLHSEWPSEEEFWHLTVDYMNNGDKDQLAKDLNAFFNGMK